MPTRSVRAASRSSIDVGHLAKVNGIPEPSTLAMVVAALIGMGRVAAEQDA